MQNTLAHLGDDEQTLDVAVALALADRPTDDRFVLVVDQLEEVFTLPGRGRSAPRSSRT